MKNELLQHHNQANASKGLKAKLIIIPGIICALLIIPWQHQAHLFANLFALCGAICFLAGFAIPILKPAINDGEYLIRTLMCALMFLSGSICLQFSYADMAITLFISFVYSVKMPDALAGLFPEKEPDEHKRQQAKVIDFFDYKHTKKN